MKSILVTGGAGFIGVNLCLKLILAGHNVFCLDNLYSSSLENIKELISNDRFTFVNHDICTSLEFDGKFNEIYHLACPASPIFYQKDPLYTLNTCYLGTRNVLEFAKRKSARVLFTSTSEVYGDPLVHPQQETYFGNVNTIGPRSCYDEGKRVAESIMINYHLQENVDIRLVRIFNTYGPRMHMDDGRVISNFILAALKNEAITIHGDGMQTRSFCYVSDMVQGLINTMQSHHYLGPINLGNPHEITLKHLCNKIMVGVGSNSIVRYVERRQDDPMQRCPDISLAKEQLEWVPQVCLDDGLMKTINYYSSLLDKTSTIV